jgi:hypothetical protein
MIPVLQEKGLRVIDVYWWAYKHKRGRDVIVEVQGHRCSIEFKLDLMSEKTGNVAIDLDSLNMTDSGIWIFGLNDGDLIHTYTMRTTDLAPFARSWPIKRHAGEFRQPVAILLKATFLGQKFVHFFKTIKLN